MKEQNHLTNIVANEMYIPYRLHPGDQLPTTISTARIAWESKPEVLTDEGIVMENTKDIIDVILSAKIIDLNQTIEKSFPVKILPDEMVRILGYTRSVKAKEEPGEMEENIRAVTDALHLAYSEDSGKTYTALHHNTGVLFPLADFSFDLVDGETKVLQDPYIFRRKDGSFGVVATRSNVDGTQTEREKTSILFFESEDLITYKEKGLISLNTDLTVRKPRVEINAVNGDYWIEWEDLNENIYYQRTSDFTDLSQPQLKKYTGIPKRKTLVSDIPYAIPGNWVSLTETEAKKVINKFSKVTNTEVMDVAVTIRLGEKYTFEDLCMERVVATYSDGSSAKKPVEWRKSDFQQIDFHQAGTYTVSGKVIQHPVYPQDWIEGYADPHICRYQGKYYFIATNDLNHNTTLDIRVADTIPELKDAKVHTILTAAPEGEDMSYCLWAPELHEVGGKLYIFFAAGVNDGWQVQARVMELKEGGNPTQASDWKKAVRVVRKDGSELSPGGITLDMTVFQDDGVTYVAWSDRVDWGATKTMIATIDPAKPWVLTSDPVEISISDYGWDRRNTTVNEGPYILKNEGKIYMAISGSAVDNTYCISYLVAQIGDNLLDPRAWKKIGYPMLTSASVPGYYGPGHNSFVVDSYGQVLNVYHARPEKGGRSSTLRIVHFSADGTPILDMTPDREILPEKRMVSAKITIKDH